MLCYLKSLLGIFVQRGVSKSGGDKIVPWQNMVGRPTSYTCYRPQQITRFPVTHFIISLIADKMLATFGVNVCVFMEIHSSDQNMIKIYFLCKNKCSQL